jgi:hypothetical protein
VRLISSSACQCRPVWDAAVDRAVACLASADPFNLHRYRHTHPICPSSGRLS